MTKNLNKIILMLSILIILTNSFVNSQVVLCNFNSELSLDFHHSPKFVHQEKTFEHQHLHEESHNKCHSSFTEVEVSDCNSCNDVEASDESNLIKKITFIYAKLVNQINLDEVEKALNQKEYKLTKNNTYFPSKTVLRL